MFETPLGVESLPCLLLPSLAFLFLDVILHIVKRGSGHWRNRCLKKVSIRPGLSFLCEQNENVERFRVNKMSGEIF